MEANVKAAEPKPPASPDRDIPGRHGEIIDDERDKRPDPDKVPDTPPTDPKPVPIDEPPGPSENQGPFIV